MEIKKGDYVLLISEDGKTYLLEVKEREFHTHKDSLFLGDLVGKSYGEVVSGKKGTSFKVVKPSLYDFLIKIERLTQIIYPKDIGIILLKLGIGPGSRVIECGGGSGALTTALAYTVGSEGKVYSYEREERFQELAKKNLGKLGLLSRVEFKLKEVKDEFDESGVDAVFLDVREPWLLVEAAWKALTPGHPLGILVPTTNQVCKVLKALKNLAFCQEEVIEVLLRPYKPNPERLRPEDRMVAHTGYLIFAKKLVKKDACRDSTD